MLHGKLKRRNVKRTVRCVQERIPNTKIFSKNFYIENYDFYPPMFMYIIPCSWTYACVSWTHEHIKIDSELWKKSVWAYYQHTKRKIQNKMMKRRAKRNNTICGGSDYTQRTRPRIFFPIEFTVVKTSNPITLHVYRKYQVL